MMGHRKYNFKTVQLFLRVYSSYIEMDESSYTKQIYNNSFNKKHNVVQWIYCTLATEK